MLEDDNQFIPCAWPMRETTTSQFFVKFDLGSSNLDHTILEELFSIYRNWQDERARAIDKKQEEIEDKIEMADALVVKLLRRLNYSVSTMRTTAHHLSAVEPFELEVGELKGRLTEAISNCEALCKRISLEGPESLRSIKPLNVSDMDPSQSASK